MQLQPPLTFFLLFAVVSVIVSEGRRTDGIFIVISEVWPTASIVIHLFSDLQDCITSYTTCKISGQAFTYVSYVDIRNVPMPFHQQGRTKGHDASERAEG